MNRNLCILLVEDDPVLGPLTADALLGLGHRLMLAATADEAYQYLSAPHGFEMVLLDLQLGATRSEPLILRLRAENTVVPPVIVFSAQPLDEVKRAARHIGARGYVQKPASIDQIQEAILAAALCTE